MSNKKSDSLQQVVNEANAAAAQEANAAAQEANAEATSVASIELPPTAPIGATRATSGGASVAKLKELLKAHPNGLTVFQVGVLLGKFSPTMDIGKSATDNELYQKVSKDLRSQLRKFIPAVNRSEKAGRNTIYKYCE